MPGKIWPRIWISQQQTCIIRSSLCDHGWCDHSNHEIIWFISFKFESWIFESRHVLYFLNYMRCTWSVFDTWKLFISNSTSSTQMHHTNQIIRYGSANSDYWNLIFCQYTHCFQLGSFYRDIEIIGVCWCSDFNCRTILILTCSQDVVSWNIVPPF
jgi:hypothetical protein